MSLSKVIRLMSKVQKISEKYASIDNEVYAEKVSDYKEEIRDRLLDGLIGGYDINGKRFKSLRPSTLDIRSIRGVAGKTPLRANGGIERFLESEGLFAKGKLQIKLNPPPEEYMVAQNEGFTPTYIPKANKRDEIGYFKNKTGISVPARQWYGLPKTYLEGGVRYNEFIKKITKEFDRELSEAIR
tara:strand:- start:2697 stop:3251 length:555 start_codon:yes stop_codon:yes gene_type:complete